MAWPANAQPTSPVEREGAFTLFKFAKAIGREHYTVTQTARDLKLRDDFLFTDRGTRVPLHTTFLADADLRPRQFVTEGDSSRTSRLHDTLTARGQTVHLVRDGQPTELPLPAGAFFIDGYAPVAMQQLLLRFWLTHGRPASIPHCSQ